MRGPPPAALLLVCVVCVAIALAPLLLAAASKARENDVLAELCVGLALVACAMLPMQFVSPGRFAARGPRRSST